MYFILRLVISILNANPTWPTSAANPFLPIQATKIMFVEKAPYMFFSEQSIPAIIISWNLNTLFGGRPLNPFSTISGWAGGGCSYPFPNTPRFRFRSCCFAHSPFLRLWIHTNSLVANTIPRVIIWAFLVFVDTHTDRQTVKDIAKIPSHVGGGVSNPHLIHHPPPPPPTIAAA